LLLLGFGIKLAILPLHTWLPTTYAAAHPNTTSLIASVVAKLGLYGILRIVIPLTPAPLSYEAQMVIGTLGAIAIVYGAMIALTKDNLRHVLAYSSLSHVGFITLGLMSLTKEGLGGAALQMFNHGLITAAMFWILSMLEERRGTISLANEDRGMAAQYPKLAVLLVFFTLAGAGLPGLNGFVGELLTMTGMMRVCGTLVAIAVLGTVLGAWYGLKIVQRLLFGSNGHTVDLHHHPKGAMDLAQREWLPLVAVAFLCLYIGLFPMRTMKLFQPDTDRLATWVEPVSKQAHPKMDVLASNSGAQ
jgi:NADH-quinone oxidoreductase subunit M